MNKTARGKFKLADRRKRGRTCRAHEYFLRAGRAAGRQRGRGGENKEGTRRISNSQSPAAVAGRERHFELKECHRRRLPRGIRENTKTFIYITTGVTKARWKSNHIKTHETAPRTFESAAAGRRMGEKGVQSCRLKRGSRKTFSFSSPHWMHSPPLPPPPAV